MYFWTPKISHTNYGYGENNLVSRFALAYNFYVNWLFFCFTIFFFFQVKKRSIGSSLEALSASWSLQIFHFPSLCNTKASRKIAISCVQVHKNTKQSCKISMSCVQVHRNTKASWKIAMSFVQVYKNTNFEKEGLHAFWLHAKDSSTTLGN